MSHPNVCRVYDIGEVDGENFISMEYVYDEDWVTAPPTVDAKENLGLRKDVVAR